MLEELEAIILRDIETDALWFTGPKSFSALAARDRRLLLQERRLLLNELIQVKIHLKEYEKG